MQRARVKLALAVALVGTFAASSAGLATAGHRDSTKYRADLTGFEEVPAVSSVGGGEFRARMSGDAVKWTLSYRRLEAPVAQAHIHVGQTAVNGGVAVFLCGGGPAGAPACPPAPATISGTFDAGDVIGPVPQGVAAGELDELVRAMNAGVAYVNVHTSKFPNGEIRGQIGARGRGGKN